MDKTLMKTVTKTKDEDTKDVTWKITPSKQLFMPLLRTSEENAKNSGRHKGRCWTLIIFPLTLAIFSYYIFAQTSTIAKLFIKVYIWLVQSFKVQSSQLSTILSNPPFAYVISSIWYSPLPFWLCLFAIVSGYYFTSEIQELMFLS